MTFRTIYLTREVEDVEENKETGAREVVTKEIVDFLGEHTIHGKQSTILLKEPRIGESSAFTQMLINKLNSLSLEDRKIFLDSGMYRIEFDSYFEANAYKYIYLEDSQTLLYSSKSEVEKESNATMFNYILCHIKNFFFTSSSVLLSWNAKKVEEEKRAMVMMQKAMEVEQGMQTLSQGKLGQ